jgi:hypothetical protein
MRAAKGVEPALYNIPQVYELLSIGRSSAYKLISSGRLQTVRIPGLTSMGVTAESVRDLLASAPAANRAGRTRDLPASDAILLHVMWP